MPEVFFLAGYSPADSSHVFAAEDKTSLTY
ncbi:hypothetical protein BMYO_1981 [Bifidobacterium myosotis]|uniref:Uncharacterized protein n=1 Tax=Bifidobacterium myosotis TaxID=1630166 RepID=A0A261FEB7_9BIFI|nr:hypothetical protein BMYO_1981 [Bifidobacterium myosotis]